jgi:hypothetical protein
LIPRTRDSQPGASCRCTGCLRRAPAQKIVPPGRPCPHASLKENLMGRMVAAIITSVLLAASFVDAAFAGWSW